MAAPNEEAFSYDAVGNRLSGPGPKDTAYLYNSANQMTQGRKLTNSYDDNGNQISRSVPGAPDKSWTQTWDYENRLVKVEKVKGAERKTVTFSYDALGRRIGKTLRHTKGGATITRSWSYVYDNDDIVFEEMTDGSGTTKTFYTHGQNVDEHLGMERNEQFSYYHADALGSVVAVTDGSGQVVQRYEYDSFGEVWPLDGSIGNSYTYTGREWDKETGLYYYRARYYDPLIGRFTSKDPIGISGGINLYSYVKNNVINFTDAYGLICCAKTEIGEIVRRIKEVNSILSALHRGVMPSGKEELGKTSCWPGGNPTWRTSSGRGECVKECLEEHEAVHGLQCITLGYRKFNSLSRSEEIRNEIAGYKMELSCLEAKRSSCK